MRSVVDFFNHDIIERIQVRGATPEGGVDGNTGMPYVTDNHFSDSWYCGINIGCSREPVVRDCYLMGPFREKDMSLTLILKTLVRPELLRLVEPL